MIANTNKLYTVLFYLFIFQKNTGQKRDHIESVTYGPVVSYRLSAEHFLNSLFNVYDEMLFYANT